MPRSFVTTAVHPYLLDSAPRGGSCNAREPFASGKRGEPSSSHGLGLHISREIVAAHGGTIEVVGEGDGTRFTVRLPRTPPARA